MVHNSGASHLLLKAKNGPAPGVLTVNNGHGVVEAVEAAEHVAGLDCDNNLEAAGKTQHCRGFSSSRMRATASGIWPGVLMASLVPPGQEDFHRRAGGMHGVQFGGNEGQEGGMWQAGSPCGFLGFFLRFWSQLARV